MRQDHDEEEPPAIHHPTFAERLRRELAWLDDFIKRWMVRLVIIAAHILLVLAACYGVVWGLSYKQLYSSVDDIPVRYAGLVLGCPKMAGAEENAFFTARVEAAHQLLQAGKVQYLIVSGNGSSALGNEAQDMKDALMAKGVPADRIYCDYAGFRTLDSVIRARKIFGQRDMTIISQPFHNHRALYIARRHGLPDSVAFNAKDADPKWMLRMHLREILARVMAVLDVEILHTEPKELGEKINVGPHWPPVDAAAK